MTNEEIWRAALGELELTLSRANFTTWFKNTCIIESTQAGEYTIGVPNAFTEEWLKNKYHKQISQVLQNVTSNRVTKLTYTLNTKQNKEKVKKATQQETQRNLQKEYPQPGQTQKSSPSSLNPKYIFETYVVGSSNKLAHAAAQAIAKDPGINYNPFFIYGGVGLGKTHLVQSIGNTVLSQKPNAKVVYVTCEKFTDDFINYIRREKGQSQASSFKTKYRTADILIVDDIQFLSGKEGTQEEFFHTFNELYQNNKHVILTSDRPPKAITALEDRLLSRFEGGMVADVTLPDQETRRAILCNKCKEKGIELNDEILGYIAENIKNNIRELEGALSRVIAYCQLNNEDATIDIVKNVLASVITSPKATAITPKKILETVSVFYDLNPEQLIAKNRKKEIAWPRQIAMYLMREEAKTSYPTIGHELGGRDHTTAMHAYEKVSQALKDNSDAKQEIELIRQKIHASY
jgi:chromosomal replication initiator protein